MDEDQAVTLIVDSAVHLHPTLGPGLLESVFEVTLSRRPEKEGLWVKRQVSVPVEFEGERFDEGFRAGLIVEGKVIVELKSVRRVDPAHKKQVLTCPKLTGLKLGYLLNSGEALMKDGITRIIHGEL